MNYRNFTEEEKQEVMEELFQSAQLRFKDNVKGIRESEFTTGAHVEIYLGTRYGMFREDSRVVADIFNEMQNKYEASPYGQEGVYRFKIEKRG